MRTKPRTKFLHGTKKESADESTADSASWIRRKKRERWSKHAIRNVSSLVSARWFDLSAGAFCLPALAWIRRAYWFSKNSAAGATIGLVININTSRRLTESRGKGERENGRGGWTGGGGREGWGSYENREGPKFLTKGGKRGFRSIHLIILRCSPLTSPRSSVLSSRVSKLNVIFAFPLFAGKWRHVWLLCFPVAAQQRYRFGANEGSIRGPCGLPRSSVGSWVRSSIIKANSCIGRVMPSRTCRKIKDNRVRLLLRCGLVGGPGDSLHKHVDGSSESRSSCPTRQSKYRCLSLQPSSNANRQK